MNLNCHLSPINFKSIKNMSIFICTALNLSFVSFRYDAYSMFYLSTSDYEYDNYNLNFEETQSLTRASTRTARMMHGMLCNAEGETEGKAYTKCPAQVCVFQFCRNRGFLKRTSNTFWTLSSIVNTKKAISFVFVLKVYCTEVIIFILINFMVRTDSPWI